MNFVIRDLLYCLGVTEKMSVFLKRSTLCVCPFTNRNDLCLLQSDLTPMWQNSTIPVGRMWRRTFVTTVTIAWQLRPDILSFLANRTLGHKPSNTEFISILVHYLKGPVSKTAIQPFAQIS